MSNEKSASQVAEELVQEAYNKFQQNNYTAALQLCQAALAIYEGIDDRFGEACALNNLGNFYQEQSVISYSQEIFKEFDNAQEKTQSNLANSVKSKPNWFVPGVNGKFLIYGFLDDTPRTPPITKPPSAMNVGDVLLEKSRKQYEDKYLALALKSCQEGLTIYQEISDRLGEACTVNNLGNIYQAQAAESYSQALAIFKKIDNQAGEKATKQNLKQPVQSVPNWLMPGAGESVLIVRSSGVVDGTAKKPPITQPPEFTQPTPGNNPTDPGNVA